jgi:hypothetical protein
VNSLAAVAFTVGMVKHYATCAGGERHRARATGGRGVSIYTYTHRSGKWVVNHITGTVVYSRLGDRYVMYLCHRYYTKCDLSTIVY